MINLQERAYQQLEPIAWGKPGLSPANRIISLIICASVIVAILESEQVVFSGRENAFRFAELLIAGFFLLEYVARVWVSPLNPKYEGRYGRLRYMFSFSAIIDLLALAPLLFVFVGSEAFLLRLIRLVRIFRLARLGRFSKAMNAIAEAVQSRRYELLMSLSIAGILLLVSSTLLYIVESDVQPETFGSIPRAMWWSIATLTTVGYGDAFPVTPVGKMLAGATAITGIGLIAMPTGILAAAFSDALQRQRDQAPPKDG